MSRYAVGVDFGTESGRAVLVDCADGRELGTAIYAYANGVIDERLPAPADDVALEPDWALQDPDDYLRDAAGGRSGAARETGVDPARGRSASGSTSPRARCCRRSRDGTPLCLLDELRREPHAWVKLWKHHAAQPEADRDQRGRAPSAASAGCRATAGKISSEWFFAKALQILHEAPEIYARADRLIEAADWVVWQLTGVETRNACTAGYKAMWSKARRASRRTRTSRRSTRASSTSSTRRCRATSPRSASRAGGLTERGSRLDRPARGHAGGGGERRRPCLGPGRRRDRAGTHGDDHGHQHLPHPARRRTRRWSRACAGSSRTAWCRACSASRPASRRSATSSPGSSSTPCRPTTTRPRRAGLSVHEVLEEDAARCARARAGCWRSTGGTATARCWSMPTCAACSSGMTLATQPAEIYRALIEATAFGTRVIVEAFESGGVPVNAIVACGGLPERNQLLMQIYADVHGPRDRGRRVEPGARARRGDVRRGRRRRRGRRLRHDRRRGAGHGRPRARRTARSPRTTRSTTSCTASTAGCTTSSAAAATT